MEIERTVRSGLHIKDVQKRFSEIVGSKSIKPNDFPTPMKHTVRLYNDGNAQTHIKQDPGIIAKGRKKVKDDTPYCEVVDSRSSLSLDIV